MMPAAGYLVSKDDRLDLLEIELTGVLFCMDNLSGLLTDSAVTVARLGLRPCEHLLLLEAVKSDPHSSDILEFFAAFLHHPLVRPRRLAVVTADACLRAGLDRVAHGIEAELFDDRDGAIGWLSKPRQRGS